MAIITPSALIDEIKGRFNGDVFQMWKGILYRRKGTFPRQPKTTSQTLIRSLVSSLSGEFDGLSSARKTAWDYYAGQLPTSMSGFNTWIRNNGKLLYADYSTLIKIYDPPEVPSAPSAPTSFSLTYDATNDRWEASWSTPTAVNLYVQLFLSIVTGYRDTLFPMWSFSSTKPAHQSPIYHSAGDYISGTQVRGHLRVLDEDGQASSWTSTKEATKT